MGFKAGAYTWKFRNLSLGVLASAPVLTLEHITAPITADIWGGQEIDGIYLNKTGTIEMVCQEWDAPGVQAVLQLFNGSVSNVGTMARLGCPWSTEADVLWAQRIGTGSPCGAVYEHFVAYRAMIAPSTPITQDMGQSLMAVPLRFDLLPYEEPVDSGSLHVCQFADTLPSSNPPVRADAQDVVAYVQNQAS